MERNRAERRREQRLEKKEKNRGASVSEQPSLSPFGESRRKLLGWGAATAGLLALGGWHVLAPRLPDQHLEFSENLNVPVPNHRLLHEPVPLPQPEGLDVEDREYQQITGMVTEIVEQIMTAYLAPAIRNTPQNAEQHNEQFIRLVIEAIYRLNNQPLIRSLESFMGPARNFNATDFVQYLNTFTANRGLVNYIDTDLSTGLGTIRLNHIQKKSGVLIQDGNAEHRFPVLHLENSPPSTATPTAVPRPAITQYSGIILYNPMAQQLMLDIFTRGFRFRHMPNFDLQKNNTLSPSQISPMLESEILGHEAMHCLLTQKFPAYRKMDAIQGKKYSISIPYTRGNQKMSYDRNCSWSDLNELAGIGYQFATTTLSLPFTMAFMLLSPEAQYELSRDVLALALRLTAPDSETTRTLLNEDASPSPESLIQILGHPPFGLEHINAIGKTMYGIAMTNMKRIHNGELQPLAAQSH